MDRTDKNNQVADAKPLAVSVPLGNDQKEFSNFTKLSKEQIIIQALNFHSKGNIIDAAKYYQYCIKKDFNDHRVFSNYGLILKDVGKLKEAELSTRKAIEIKPDDASAHSNLGGILKDLGRLEEAELSTRKAIKIKPDHASAYSNLGGILKDLGRLEEAELSTRKAIEIKPDHASAHGNLGGILKDLDRLTEAEIFTRKSIEINPASASAYCNLAGILKEVGKLKEAELSIRKAIKIKPDYAIAYSNLGGILKDLGRLEEAEIATNKAIEINPDFADAFSNLGSILNDLGKSEEVEACYSKALSLNPNLYNVLKKRWQFFFDKGEFESALKDADSCNTHNSRAFALEALFALGRIDEIYKRIDKTSKIDSENIRLAAFSSFISAQERKKTSNNFCHNPLSFLYFSNLKSHAIDYFHFVRDIINELDHIETVWEPKGQTTYNGFQTPIYKNLFSNSSENISKLHSIILDELENYFVKYEQEKCSYIKKWPSIKNLVGWHVILKKQGYQSAHIHPAGWLSGVIYLKVVPPLNNDEGAIEFSLNGVNYFNANSPKLTYQPDVGDIVFFPSSLHHRTIPFSTDADRIVIAFDLMPAGYKSNLI